MKLPYGFYLNSDGAVSINEEKANTVRLIYRQYISGMSLGGIADLLYLGHISSPKGKERWTQAVISGTLSNPKYIDAVIPFDEYFAVQFEKGKRGLNDEYTGKRKATRYNSKSVLSGLLVCEECGCNYRRITRPSGEVVWRCANRVEHGKQFCKSSPTITEQEVITAICRTLRMTEFDEQKVRNQIEKIVVGKSGTLNIEIRHQIMAQSF